MPRDAFVVDFQCSSTKKVETMNYSDVPNTQNGSRFLNLSIKHENELFDPRKKSELKKASVEF